MRFLHAASAVLALALAACSAEESGGENAAQSADALSSTWSSFVATPPARAYDSRTAQGPVSAGSEVCIPMAGAGHVPADATAVVINLTAADATAPGYLTAYPGGFERPVASNVNFLPGDAVANGAVIPIGPRGDVCVFNSAGSTNVIVDVSGYTRPDREGLLFNATTPTRLLDTRAGARPAAGSVQRVTVSGQRMADGDAIPREARMAVVNITATDTAGAGYVTAYPAGGERPPTSSLNFGQGATRANLAFVTLDASGAFELYAQTPAHLIVDLVGYLRPGVGGAYMPIVPRRTYDSRTESRGKLRGQETRKIPLSGRAASVPEGGAVLANVTAAEPTSAGFFTAGASGPVASSVNFTAGATVPNLVATWTDASGDGYFYNHTGSAHIVVDVLGVFSTPPNPAPPVLPKTRGLDVALATLAKEVPQRTPGTEASFAVLDLATGEYAGVLDDEPRVSASSAKAIWVAGALSKVGIGPVSEFAGPIFEQSDNYASGSAIDLVGINAMNDFYSRAGMKNSALISWSFGATRNATNRPYVLGSNNYFTARDVVTFLEGIGRGTLLGAAENAQLQEWMRRAPRSGGVAGAIGTLLPADVRAGVMHKAGWLPPGSATTPAAINTHNEIALVPYGDDRMYAVSILLHGGSDYYGAQIPFLEHASCAIYVAVSGDERIGCD